MKNTTPSIHQEPRIFEQYEDFKRIMTIVEEYGDF
jgi:hypothetical protein